MKDADEIDRSPWCAGCDHSMPDRDHAHKWIRMDGRKVGPFCTRNCAFCWVIRNDERALNYLDFEAIAEGPELVTDGGRVQDGDAVERLYKRDREVRCNLCRERYPDLRPCCVENRTEIPLMCDTCYVDLRNAGRLDLERDAEVFGYANHV